MVSEKTNRFEKNPVLTISVLLIMLFLMLDVLLGWIFIPEDYQSFRVSDPWYHHGILPNQKSIANWGQKYYKFYSNSLGFRDDTIKQVHPQSSKKRILFMGDSHTEAVGIPYNESFTGRLSEALEPFDIEVLNGSAVSYSPKIHYLKTKYLIEEVKLNFEELFVVIDMSDLNNEIAYENFSPRERNKISRQLMLAGKKAASFSFTSYHLSNFIKKRKNKIFYDNITNKKEGDFELYATFFSDFDKADLIRDPNFHNVSKWLYDDKFKDLVNRSLTLARENISRLHQLCKSHGIKLTVTVHPWQEQILKGETENVFVNSWEQYCQSNDIGFISFYPVFINGSNNARVAELYYIKHDNHWNSRGHELVFHELFNHIINRE